MDEAKKIEMLTFKVVQLMGQVKLVNPHWDAND
jgi:hypothetical protein